MESDCLLMEDFLLKYIKYKGHMNDFSERS